MRRDLETRVARQLAAAPASVRDRMVADAANLRPGAAAAVGRFFAALAARREPFDAPSRAVFDAAAQSEPTLHTLLVTLDRYAPGVCLAAGREARRAWYRRRRKAAPSAPRVGRDRRQLWPPEWAAHLPALDVLRRSLSNRTVSQYLVSIDRCAQALHLLGIEPVLDRWTAFQLVERFRAEGLRWATCANYITGLDALARVAGVDAASRSGIFEIVLWARSEARIEGKLKHARLAKLNESGGYGLLGDEIGRQRDAAREARAWTAAAERRLQTTALLALIVNDAPRSSDLTSWRLGVELIRAFDGTWSLAWTQGKNDHEIDHGSLWPAVSEILDELLCRGFPLRTARVRYAELSGRNWLTHEETGRPGRWATRIVKQVLGNPIHDIRTLAFDYLRQHDPATAARIGSVFLGHRDPRTGDAYRSRDAGVAASRSWREDRKQIGAPPGRRRSRSAGKAARR